MEISDEMCAALVLAAERRILLIGLELFERLFTLMLHWPARRSGSYLSVCT